MHSGGRNDQPDAEYTVVTGNTNVKGKGNARGQHQSCKKRTRLIILRVLIAVVVVAILVAVVVVVVVAQKKDHKSGSDKPTCGPYSYPGINISQLAPRVISSKWTCPLKGNCWTGEQCYECFELDTWKVGNINNIPVCCPQCLISGLSISNSRCDCRALMSSGSDTNSY